MMRIYRADKALYPKHQSESCCSMQRVPRADLHSAAFQGEFTLNCFHFTISKRFLLHITHCGSVYTRKRHKNVRHNHGSKNNCILYLLLKVPYDAKFTSTGPLNDICKYHFNECADLNTVYYIPILC